MSVNKDRKNIGPRITILSTPGKRLARFGESGLGIGQFIAPHGICSDSNGDLYVGEVAWTHMRNLETPVDQIRSFQKLVKS